MIRLAACFVVALLVPFGAKAAPQILAATLHDPTPRYDHAVLGDALEYGAMVIVYRDCPTCPANNLRITLPQHQVFEDIEARVADLDGDGIREILVVLTDITQGAALAVFDLNGLVAATPFLGERNRWLAPVGAGDFDDDGRPEIAYIDRPHLKKELVFIRYADRKLTEISRVSGLTNHRLGDNFIQGGVRRCGGRDAVLVANADWSQVMEVRLDGKAPVALARYYSPRAMTRVQHCR